MEVATIGGNKLSRSVALVKAVETLSVEQGSDAPVVDLVQKIFGVVELHHSGGDEISELQHGLKLDGFEYTGGVLLPSTPEPAALAPESSTFEAELDSQGLNVSRTHYTQACENIVAGHFESANGQVRSYLENFFILTCEKATGTRFSDASAALQHLRDKGIIEASEWNTFRGFWDTCQSNGPHHGLSSSEEAMYRLHIATAIGRYVLKRT